DPGVDGAPDRLGENAAIAHAAIAESGAAGRVGALHLLQKLGHGPALAERLTGARAALVLRVDPAFERGQSRVHVRCVQRRIQVLIAVEIPRVQHEYPAAGTLRLHAGVEQEGRGRGRNAGETGGIAGHGDRCRAGAGNRKDEAGGGCKHGADGCAQHLHDSRPYALDDIATRSGSARTRSRNLSPRISKLRYWSNEAQAGDSRTTGWSGPDALGSGG